MNQENVEINASVSTPYYADDRGRIKSKYLSLMLLVVCGAIFITGIIAVGYAAIMSNFFAIAMTSEGFIILNDQGYTVMLISFLVATILSVIDSFYISFSSARKGRLPLVGAVIYVALTGLMIGSLLFVGISISMMAEALGLTAVCFLLAFLVGFFVKRDLSLVAYVAINVLMGIVVVSLFFGIFYLISPSAYLWINYLISLLFVVVLLILVAADVNSLSKRLVYGNVNSNLILYGGFMLYVDFIAIFVRILYLVAVSRNN